jgi:hypothetical protein
MNKENQTGRCEDVSPTSPPVKVQRLGTVATGLQEVTDQMLLNQNIPLGSRDYIGEKIIRIKQVWNNQEPLIRLEDLLSQMGSRF